MRRPVGLLRNASAPSRRRAHRVRRVRNRRLLSSSRGLADSRMRPVAHWGIVAPNCELRRPFFTWHAEPEQLAYLPPGTSAPRPVLVRMAELIPTFGDEHVLV